jgi:hypothetical protein
MSHKYRGTVQANHYRDRFMLAPGVKFEAARDSKKLAKEATAAFIALLSRTIPEEGATAYFEHVCPRSGPRTLVRYSGKPSARDSSGRPSRGKWFLEVDVEGYAFPEGIDV